MIIPQFVLRTVTLFGGIAVEKAMNKILPVSMDEFKKDAVATIGTALIQAAAVDSIMTYIENRIVNTFENIAVPSAELEEIPAEPEPQAKSKQTKQSAK
jgi:hypothetical protein